MLRMNILNYRAVVPKIRDLVDLCRQIGIPIFYTETSQKPSGIDLVTKVHRICYQNSEKRRQQRFQSEYVKHGMHKQ